MISVVNLDKKPLQDLLRDKVWLMDYMKRIATKLWIDVWSGKWMYKFRTAKVNDKILPQNFPDMCWKLLEIIDIYITCKQYWHPVNATTQETLLFCEFKALEKKVLESKKNSNAKK
jgi:hypothetical protein